MRAFLLALLLLVGASGVGKSWITTALCAWLRAQGVRVAPFKAQNMSNNAWATLDGREMARAQAVQAEACGLTPRAIGWRARHGRLHRIHEGVFAVGHPNISLHGEFVATAKNRPAADFLAGHHFQLRPDGLWTVCLERCHSWSELCYQLIDQTLPSLTT